MKSKWCKSYIGLSGCRVCLLTNCRTMLDHVHSQAATGAVSTHPRDEQQASLWFCHSVAPLFILCSDPFRLKFLRPISPSKAFGTNPGRRILVITAVNACTHSFLHSELERNQPQLLLHTIRLVFLSLGGADVRRENDPREAACQPVRMKKMKFLMKCLHVNSCAS